VKPTEPTCTDESPSGAQQTATKPVVPVTVKNGIKLSADEAFVLLTNETNPFKPHINVAPSCFIDDDVQLLTVLLLVTLEPEFIDIKDGTEIPDINTYCPLGEVQQFV
jgi:hypothetical protein